MPAFPPRSRAAVLAPLTALAVALILIAAPAAFGAPKLEGTFEVPGVEINNKIVSGPDGNMWVTVTNGEKDVAKITPAGKVEEFELNGVEGAIGIAVGPGGTMWVTTNKGVASFKTNDPKGTSNATEFPGVTGFAAIVAGPDGQMWVAASEDVVQFPPSNPSAPVKHNVAELMPKDIDVAGSLIVVSDNGAKNRIVTFTTGGAEKDFAIPGGSQGLAGAPNGQIAFSAAGASPEQSGLITPPNPAQSFEMLGDPFGVALGADKAFWIVQTMTGAIQQVMPNGAHAAAITGLPKEAARQIAAGPNNTLWVTIEEKLNVTKPSVAKIGGVESPPQPVVAPQTTIAKGPGKVVRTHRKTAKVTFRFKSSVAGSSFECALVKVRKGKGKKVPQPRFKACRSPRSFQLRPGSYRFWVRASVSGVADASPARRAFRVVRVPRHRHVHG